MKFYLKFKFRLFKILIRYISKIYRNLLIKFSLIGFEQIKNNFDYDISLQEALNDVQKKSFKLNHQIDNIFLSELSLTTQIVPKKKNNIFHGAILYSELKNYLEINKIKKINILEIGTARGFSAICMAKCLDDLDQIGNIFTIDILPHNFPIQWNVKATYKKKLTRKNLIAKWSYLVEKFIFFIQGDSIDVLHNFNITRVHFAFIDGSHTEEYVKSEINFISKYQKKSDLVILDDYDDIKYPGLKNYIDKIIEKNIYKLSKTFEVSPSRKIVILGKN